MFKFQKFLRITRGNIRVNKTLNFRRYSTQVPEAVRIKLKELNLKEVKFEETKSTCNITTNNNNNITTPKTNVETILAMAREELENSKVLATLEDNFSRHHNYLRISLSERCNLRCLYCMPEEGVPLTPNEELLTSEEIIRLVRIFASEGVNKIRFTGGEPLIRKDIEEIVEEVAKIEGIKNIGLTTNGIVLARKLPSLRSKGLNLINISLDTLQPEKFFSITRRNGFDKVMKSIDTALELGFDPVKINCVVMKGLNEHEILDFVELTKLKNFDIRFIEYMPFDGNNWVDEKILTYQDMISIIKQSHPNFVRQSDLPNDTAKSWKVEGYRGTISFITSMTENFCSSCNRLRLTADGNLKVCLFGSAEVSLRDVMRANYSDDDIRMIISCAVKRKKARHAGMHNLVHMKNRPMILIGG